MRHRPDLARAREQSERAREQQDRAERARERAADDAFREREVKVKENECALKGREAKRWFTPVFVAIIAASAAVLANVGVSLLNGSQARDLERQKAAQVRADERARRMSSALSDLSRHLERAVQEDFRLVRKLHNAANSKKSAIAFAKEWTAEQLAELAGRAESQARWNEAMTSARGLRTLIATEDMALFCALAAPIAVVMETHSRLLEVAQNDFGEYQVSRRRGMEGLDAIRVVRGGADALFKTAERLPSLLAEAARKQGTEGPAAPCK